MFCEKYKDQGILYLYDELKENEKKSFEDHLTRCAACSNELKVLTNSRGLYRLIPPEEPEPELVRHIIHMGRKQDGLFSLYLENVFELVKSLFSPKWRLALVPLVLVLFIMIVVRYIVPSLSTRNDIVAVENVLDWDLDLDGSFAAIDRQINALKSGNDILAENSILNSIPAEQELDPSSEDQLSQIDQEIQELSTEINHLKF